ncbi:hypothetical protein CYMTET_7657 [Cymbomonas tetramitiformis]|uniref:Uncharacterized protein n=1 Tax=Cymbomonas tetramitiformis TaxID=36881 RepID=A0AAE0GUM1_9CHLO|nr:hypothetical protein CYMTET_7657 [Cymbomonas tetramitiformis]
MWAGCLEETVEDKEMVEGKGGEVDSGKEEEKEMVREVAMVWEVVMETVVVAVVREVRELEGLAQVEVVSADGAGWVVARGEGKSEWVVAALMVVEMELAVAMVEVGGKDGGGGEAGDGGEGGGGEQGGWWWRQAQWWGRGDSGGGERAVSDRAVGVRAGAGGGEGGEGGLQGGGGGWSFIVGLCVGAVVGGGEGEGGGGEQTTRLHSLVSYSAAVQAWLTTVIVLVRY